MVDKCPNCGETLITSSIKKKIGTGSIDYPISQKCPKCKWSKDLTGAGDIVAQPVFMEAGESKKEEARPEIKPLPKPSGTTASPGINKFIPIALAILVIGAIAYVFFINPAEEGPAVNPPAPTPTPAVTRTPVQTAAGTPAPAVTATGKQISVKLETIRGITPKTVTIKAGDEVVWTNDGTYAVTLVSSDGIFEDKFLNNAKRMNYIFMKPGTYGFYLKHDKNLSGTVVVETQTIVQSS